MDQYTRERRFARCSQMWDAARSRRNFRTHWQDQAAAKTARRNKIKAHALTALSETLLIAATLTAGLSIYHLTASAPYSAVVLAISVAFGVDRFLSPLLTDTFGPTIDRLRGLETKGAEQ